MHRNKSASVHQFAMVPRSEIPRSTFLQESTHKTTFDAGYLVPVYWNEVLPGDSISLKATIFGRLATPIFPIMDNMYMDTQYFFVPYRLVWDNWQKFMGEQRNPGDSISYLVPTCQSPTGGYAANSLHDYFGLPTVGQVDPAQKITHDNLMLRGYNLIYNEWYRDENLQNSIVVDTDDGPDDPADYVLRRRGKRADYFTSALPWPQKGASVTIPLGGAAPIRTFQAGTGDLGILNSAGNPVKMDSSGTFVAVTATSAVGNQMLSADLSVATAATINQLRQSFQIQKLLERDARGGTRYTEILRAHFGVTSPDARLQRPEYLGGSTSMVNVSPIAQNSGTGASGTTTPVGTLAAMGTVLHKNGFSQAFTEHGFVIGIASVRADLTYQQGLARPWSRQTRYDFYWPEFAHLGEQTILNKEIYARGVAADENVFGYQERYAEYRYKPNLVTGLMRSTTTGTLDAWHLAQKFTALPTLNDTFIQENPPVDRVVAVGSAALGKQFIIDSIFTARMARPMPMYGVPGLIDHF